MKIAFIILTCENFFSEASIVKNKLSKYKITDYANCYLASKNIEFFKENQFNHNWNMISIPNRISSWGKELKYVLESIDEEYIFLWVDDIYPIDPINFENLFKKINDAIAYNPHLIRINSPFNRRKKIKYLGHDLYIELKKHKYISSVVLGIFNKKFLQNIVRIKDNPWEFEYNSKNRFKFNKNKFIFINNPSINIINIVVKGKILNSSFFKLDKSEKNSLINNSIHKRFNIFNEIFYLIKLWIARIFYYPNSYE